MSTAKKPLSRRGALLAGTAALAGGIGLPGAADASVRWPADARLPRPRLTPLQQAGQRVIYSYPGPTPPSPADPISAGQAAGVDLLRREHLQHHPDRR